MVAVKAGEVKRLLSSPSTYDAYLFFGPDQGLVSERAALLSKNLSANISGPTEQITILNDDLAANPERLSLDLKTISMFGERKILRVNVGKDLPISALETLLKSPPFEADLILEASDLKKTAKLRKLFEASPNTAAISCYADTTTSLHALVKDVMSTHNLSITPETESYLVSRLGADRALSRNELEKLALYAQNNQQITIEDINTILGDMSEIAIDTIITGTLLGTPQTALNQLSRAIETGLNPAPIFLGLLRQLHQLHKGALSVNAGQTINAVAKAHRPPLYFERRDNFIKQLNLWREDHLAHAIEKVHSTMGRARKRNNPSLEISELETLILSLSNFAKQKKV